MEIAQENGDFAGFLLKVLISNLLLYTSYYILMKLRYGERITRQPLFYFCVSLMAWVGALAFYVTASTNWVVPPAESRHMNTECKLFMFYDNHDIWHFLSATSLFLNYMLLLTLDDDLAAVAREKIPVF